MSKGILALVNNDGGIVRHIVVGPRVVDDHEAVDKAFTSSGYDDGPHAQEEAVNHRDVGWVD